MSNLISRNAATVHPAIPPPPEPTTTPPPIPPPPKTPSFDDGAEFIKLDILSDHTDDDHTNDEMSHKTPLARGRSPENSRKRKSEVVEDGTNPSRNVRSKTNVLAESRTTPWMRFVEWEGCLNAAEMLHREVEGFYRYLSPTDEEHAARTMVIQIIERAIVTTFPDARLAPFGSYETRLYLPTGDIDLVLQSPIMASYDRRPILYLLAAIMKRAEITNHVTVIAKARVPIIKFVTRIGKFPVDISINQDSGIKTGSLINSYLDAFPAARRLTLLVKAFLQQREINEVFSGGLGSYSTVLLVISFLQMHPKIRRAEIDPMQNLGVLTNEFLELYGKCFNYNEVGVSVLDGGTYFCKKDRGWGRTGMTSLAIEDPCDTDNDVSAGSFAMHRVRNAFSGAHDALTISLLRKAQNLMDLGRQYYERERGDSRRGRRIEPDYSSMLSTIVGVTESVIHHRRLVQSVWEQGTLHIQLGVPFSHENALKKDTRSKQASEAKDKRKKRLRSPRVSTSSSKDNQNMVGDRFSMDRELAMDISDGEILYVGSESEEEEESRCFAKPSRSSKLKEASRNAGVVDREAKEDMSSDGSLRRRSNLKSPLSVNMARKREYWSSKATIAFGTP